MSAVPAAEWLARLEAERDGGPYLCPTSGCDRDFESVAGLRGHLRAAHDDQVVTRSNGQLGEFPCPDCGEVFRKNQGLGSHRARSHAKPNGARAQGKLVAVAPADARPGNPGNPGIQESQDPQGVRVIARFYVPVTVLGLVDFAEAQGTRPQIRPCDDGSFEIVVES